MLPPQPKPLSGAIAAASRPGDWIRQRFSLGRSGLVATVGAVVLAITSTLIMGQLTDSVAERDGLTSQDWALLLVFVNHRSPALVHSARIVTSFGSTYALISVAVLAGAVLWFRGIRLGLALAPALALATTIAITNVTKYITGRARPPVSYQLVSVSQPSFPSGHTSGSTSLYLALGLVVVLDGTSKRVGKAVGLGSGFMAAVLVGLSRLVLGVHWFTDVLAGWALGLAIALLVVTGLALVIRLDIPNPLRRNRWHSGVRLLASQRQ